MGPARTTLIAAVAAITAIGVASVAAAAGDTGDTTSVIATFEGATIRLADGWGEARACHDDGTAARCYRSEAEMDAAEVERVVALGSCSSALRLYSGANKTGSVLSLTARQQYIGLAGCGFSDRTSSYRVGACSSRLYDAYPASGQYPGNTSAWAQADSMLSGWDNRISSVYIN